MLYNTDFIMDRLIVSTTVEAEDTGDAHSRALSLIYDELGIDLVHHRYQIQVEEN
jgi:hypothetical protein